MINSDLFIFDKKAVILMILFTKCQIIMVNGYRYTLVHSQMSVCVSSEAYNELNIVRMNRVYCLTAPGSTVMCT